MIKKRFKITLVLSLFICSYTFALAPFYQMGTLGSDLNKATDKVKAGLVDNGFEVIGEYNPGAFGDWYVLVYTSTDLKGLALGLDERSALASALKVGFIKKNSVWEVYAQNPEYLFHATFRKQMNTGLINSGAAGLNKKALDALGSVFPSKKAYGGDVSASDLHKYHYMFGMPYFSDPVELNEFDSFDQGVKRIRQNLNKQLGATVKVYEIVDAKKEIAVFGVGLLDKEDGEASFLKIIGPEHLAAMPYEIILEGKEATCLHGRYRLALNWPELTMGTFTKIMSTPGYISSTLKELTK